MNGVLSHRSRLRRCLIAAGVIITPFVVVPLDLSAEQLPDSILVSEDPQFESRLEQALAHEDMEAFHTIVGEIQRDAWQHGYEGVNEIALGLVKLAGRHLDRDDGVHALALRDAALALAPTSPEVALRSIRLKSMDGVGGLFRQILRVLQLSSDRPTTLFRIITLAIYPLLWALTLGLYSTLVLNLCFNIEPLMSGTARHLPAPLRGVVTPILVAAFLLLPCFYGPVWCIASWSLLAYFSISRKMKTTFVSGVVLTLWGAFVPVREGLFQWLQNPAARCLTQQAEGDYVQCSDAAIARLLHDFPGDATLHFAQGQRLMHLHRFDEADDSFLRAELVLGKQPWTVAARGGIALALGDGERALSLMQEALAGGANTAEAYFNISKSAFEQMDTAKSREYFLVAVGKDPVLSTWLDQREESLANIQRIVAADIRLPWYYQLSSALRPTQPLDAQFERVSAAVMLGAKPLLTCVVGLLLMFLFLAQSERVRSRGVAYYHGFHHSFLLKGLFLLIPGAGYVRAGRSGACFVALSFLVILLLPVIGWPVPMDVITNAIGKFYPYYLSGVAIYAIIIVVVGNSIAEDVR